MPIIEPTYTDRDVEHARAVWAALDPDTYDGPKTVMLSIGYADVWLDGDVTAHGVTLFNVAT